MSKRQAYSPSRQMVGGNSSGQIGSDLEKLNTSGKPPELQRAVVIDVIADPSALSEEELDELSEQVNNGELVDVMPCNSVVARIVSNNDGETAKPNTILYPFFSSHIMLPVKPGEVVYVIYEDYQDTGSALGYWLTRAHSDRTIEDVNYTHFDRRYDATHNPNNYSTEEVSRTNSEGSRFSGPGFPNGGNTAQSMTLPFNKEAEQKIEPYEEIKQQSKYFSNTATEVVPRWKKRPGEFAIQGSSNTLAFLGRDRSGGIVNDDDELKNAGFIGFVAGRSRTTPKTEETGADKPSLTNPRVVKNTRGEFETDKAPHRKGFTRRDNPKEGDLDYKNDASMLFISMQTEFDRKMNLQLNSAGSLSLPDINGRENETFNRSFVVGKADHIRLVSRKDDENGVAGTVLLVREGTPDQDLGYFFIDETGKIQIESQKIYLGKSKEETEPYIKWTEYKKSIDALQQQIDQIAGAMRDALGNLGAPIPSLFAVGTILSSLDKNELRKLQESAVEAAKSGKIFGE